MTIAFLNLRYDGYFAVVALPDDLFNKLEEAATSHKPKRILNPSTGWKLDFDVFDENLPF